MLLGHHGEGKQPGKPAATRSTGRDWGKITWLFCKEPSCSRINAVPGCARCNSHDLAKLDCYLFLWRQTAKRDGVVAQTKHALNSAGASMLALPNRTHAVCSCVSVDILGWELPVTRD